MTKNKIYIDTSVISAYFDYQKPIRQLITEKWFRSNLKDYDPYISALVIEEIGGTPDEIKRNAMLSLVKDYQLTVLPITEAITVLAEHYRKHVIPKEINDSLHIAVATLNDISAIVSWIL